MTSSLVGSEMCIRDRGYQYLRHMIQNWWDRWAPTLTTEAPEKAELRGACLLYTSDAADDM
eukprot:7285060-Prorocentrum_lima.AAC.1